MIFQVTEGTSRTPGVKGYADPKELQCHLLGGSTSLDDFCTRSSMAILLFIVSMTKYQTNKSTLDLFGPESGDLYALTGSFYQVFAGVCGRRQCTGVMALGRFDIAPFVS